MVTFLHRELKRKIEGRNKLLLNMRTILFSAIFAPVVSSLFKTLFYYYGINLISEASFFNTFIRLWVGDSIGIITIAPAIFFLFYYAKPEDIPNKRALIAVLPVLFVGITIYFLESSLRLNIYKDFNQNNLVLKNKIKNKIESIYYTASEMKILFLQNNKRLDENLKKKIALSLQGKSQDFNKWVGADLVALYEVKGTNLNGAESLELSQSLPIAKNLKYTPDDKWDYSDSNRFQPIRLGCILNS
jgi:hypothetical protein